MNLIRTIVGVILIACGLQAQNIRFGTLSPQLVLQRFEALQPKNEGREQQVKSLFAEAGCQQLEERKIRDSKLPNVICTLPGSGSRIIVVTAHYDKAGSGEGAIDNWSGAAILPS